MKICRLLNCYQRFGGDFCFRFQGSGNLGFYLLFSYLPPLNITLYFLEDLVLIVNNIKMNLQEVEWGE